MNLANSRFLKACRREAVDCTPVWFMRQAGRALPEYRAVRERYSLLEICRQPELCAEVTLQPVRRLGVDAAVLFADIMLPLVGVGVELELVERVGPVIAHPIREPRDLAALRPLVPQQDLPELLEAIRLLRRELGERVPLIGFAGAPFTLASYLVEGRPSRAFARTKALMYRAPALWHALMDRLAELTTAYLHAQVDAGAAALQLFDSWVGCLSPRDYATYVRPYTRRVLQALRPRGVPLIHFGVDTATLLDQMKDDGGTAIGVDWRVPLDEAWARLGPGLAIQGNLDPLVLLGPWELVADQAADVLRRAAGRAGHIFNLGHGVDPATPPEQLERLVEFVHAYPV